MNSLRCQQHSSYCRSHQAPATAPLGQPYSGYCATARHLPQLERSGQSRIVRQRHPLFASTALAHQLHTRMRYWLYYSEPESASSYCPEPECQRSRIWRNRITQILIQTFCLQPNTMLANTEFGKISNDPKILGVGGHRD